MHAAYLASVLKSWSFAVQACIVGCSAARLPSRVALRLAEHTKQQWAGLRMRGDSAPDLSDLQHKVEQVLSDLQGRVDGAFGDFVASCQQQYDGKRVAATFFTRAANMQVLPTTSFTCNCCHGYGDTVDLLVRLNHSFL